MSWPNSEAQSRPLESNARPCTLRWPYDQTGDPGNGLSLGTLPLGVIRRILPPSEPLSCAGVRRPASPVPTHRLPSGPKTMRPPLWIKPLGMPLKIVVGLPRLLRLYVIRTMRLSPCTDVR